MEENIQIDTIADNIAGNNADNKVDMCDSALYGREYTYLHTRFHDSDMCDILSLLGNCLISSVFSISFEKRE